MGFSVGTPQYYVIASDRLAVKLVKINISLPLTTLPPTMADAGGWSTIESDEVCTTGDLDAK